MWRNLCTSLLYFVVRVRYRRKESSLLLSHLLMSFLFYLENVVFFILELKYASLGGCSCFIFYYIE